MRGFFGVVFKLLGWVLGIGLVILAILNLFFVNRVQVSHNGMAPTLLVGEEALVWRRGEPSMGDVVVCEHPARPGQYVMGRVLAKKGMLIESPRGQLQIEGTGIDKDIRDRVRFYDSILDRTDTMVYGIAKFGNTEHEFFIREDDHLRIRPTEVTEGLYLLGDNRSVRGNDSRHFGEVDPESCVGTLFMRLRPNADDPNELDHGWLDWIS